MAKRGGQPGNSNARTGTEWRDALRWALENYQDSSIKRAGALRAIARAEVERALAGDAEARRTIGDRLDGRPAQSLAISGDADAAPIALHVSAPKPSK